MRNPGDALPAGSAELQPARGVQRAADADYGCVDWYQYQDVLTEEVLNVRVRVTARSTLTAASLASPAATIEAAALRCA